MGHNIEIDGNSYVFYEVAKSYEFVRSHSYKFVRFFAKSYVFYELPISYEFVRITYR